MILLAACIHCIAAYDKNEVIKVLTVKKMSNLIRVIRIFNLA